MHKYISINFICSDHIVRREKTKLHIMRWFTKDEMVCFKYWDRFARRWIWKVWSIYRMNSEMSQLKMWEAENG